MKAVEDIAARATESHAAAFRELADRRLEASYRLACAILGNPVEAQDATHDAFVQAWRHWPSLRDPDRADHWFSRILVNTCRNRLKRAARWPHEPLERDVAAAGDQLGQALDRDVLSAALATLSPDHQVIVAMRFYRDLTTEQIATELGIRPGTVSSRLHYAIKRLHAALDESDARRAVQ